MEKVRSNIGEKIGSYRSKNIADFKFFGLNILNFNFEEVTHESTGEHP